MVDWLTLAIPFVYLAILIGSLATFSSLYRARKAKRTASLAPYFGPHIQRDVYLSLLHLEPENGQKVPDSILKAALLRRAAEDVHRLVTIRNSKQALSQLLQKGNVGDDLWQRFERAEKEINEELKDVIEEANAFAPNWGQTIFHSAGELINNGMLRERVTEIQGTAETEKKWWANRRASIQSEFMKELDEDAAAKNKSATARRRGSEEDAVLVEAGGPDAGQ